MSIELAKKKVRILNKIKEREEKEPNMIEYSESGPYSSYGKWDLSSGEFDIDIKEFDSFITELSRNGILYGGPIESFHVPIYVNDKQIYDEDGEPISDELIIFYWNANLKKLNIYLNLLLKLFTLNEIKELKKPLPAVTIFGKVIKEAGKLSICEGGIILYDNKNKVDMRTGLKSLCEMFIDRPRQLINRDEIRDMLGTSTKNTKDTIAKYVSALNISLEPYFKRKPLINDKKEGWIFEP